MCAYKVGVLGATGVVGQEMLSVLLERKFPAASIVALASANSAGTTVNAGGQNFDVHNIDEYNTEGLDLLLASAGADVSAEYLPKIAEQGTAVIDNSSCFRNDPEVPLIIPEVNPSDCELYRNKNIIANPNCSTVLALMALATLHRVSPIKRVIASTYQSVSGAGKAALEELFVQTRGVYANESAERTRQVFTKQIAFNVIPHIDSFLDSGYTKEELKMDSESKKILHSDLNVSVTCVRVPVFVSHAMTITVQLSSDMSVEHALDLWRAAPGVSVINYQQDEGYPTPVEVAGEDNVYVSRVRKDCALPNALTFWLVGDNLRKGAALNAVQIAELLIEQGYL